MNKSLELTGRIIKTNAASQSILIAAKESQTRLWVYANNAIFDRLNRVLSEARFAGEKDREMIGTFRIQGRVLIAFRLAGYVYPCGLSLEAIKKWVVTSE